MEFLKFLGAPNSVVDFHTGEKAKRGEVDEPEEKPKQMTLPPPPAICYDAVVRDFTRCAKRDVERDALFPDEDAARDA